jgi:hypothetical protein
MKNKKGKWVNDKPIKVQTFLLWTFSWKNAKSEYISEKHKIQNHTFKVSLHFFLNTS